MNDDQKNAREENWKSRFAQLQEENASEQERDAFILEMAKSLQETPDRPMLWAKIANTLRNEKPPGKLVLFATSPLLRIAAVLILVVGAGFFWQRFQDDPVESGRILSKNALQKVIKAETDYEAAIADLEKLTSPKMRKLDLELQFLYHDKLATIDEQIGQCREALQENPGNAHIRRYMLAALQDKKSTLQDILHDSGTENNF